jgi:hypothetical protein
MQITSSVDTFIVELVMHSLLPTHVSLINAMRRIVNSMCFSSKGRGGPYIVGRVALIHSFLLLAQTGQLLFILRVRSSIVLGRAGAKSNAPSLSPKILALRACRLSLRSSAFNLFS